MSVIVVRGAGVSFAAVFRGADDKPITPMAANLRVAYVSDAGPVVEEIAMMKFDMTWRADWDSSPAHEGDAFWHVTSVGGTPISADEGKPPHRGKHGQPELTAERLGRRCSRDR